MANISIIVIVIVMVIEIIKVIVIKKQELSRVQWWLSQGALRSADKMPQPRGGP